MAWQSDDGSGLGIYIQRYNTGGSAVGVVARINTTTTGDQLTPAVTALIDGGYVVAWQSNGQDGSAGGIFAQRFDANGVAIGPESRINAVTVGNQSLPAITALLDGGYVVSWISDGAVFTQRFDDRGGTAQLTGDTTANTVTWSGSTPITLE